MLLQETNFTWQISEEILDDNGCSLFDNIGVYLVDHASFVFILLKSLSKFRSELLCDQCGEFNINHLFFKNTSIANNFFSFSTKTYICFIVFSTKLRGISVFHMLWRNLLLWDASLHHLHLGLMFERSNVSGSWVALSGKCRLEACRSLLETLLRLLGLLLEWWVFLGLLSVCWLIGLVKSWFHWFVFLFLSYFLNCNVGF